MEDATNKDLPFIIQPVTDQDIPENKTDCEVLDTPFVSDNTFYLFDMIESDVYKCDDCTELFSESSNLLHHRKENHSHIYAKEPNNDSEMNEKRITILVKKLLKILKTV